MTDRLAIGEGVETMLSAMQLGITPAWACGPADNVASFPLMDGTLIICADNDEAGIRAAKRCRERWGKRRAHIFKPDKDGDDFNDVLVRERQCRKA